MRAGQDQGTEDRVALRHPQRGAARRISGQDGRGRPGHRYRSLLQAPRPVVRLVRLPALLFGGQAKGAGDIDADCLNDITYASL